MAADVLGDRRLAVRAGLALVLANGRYWTSVAPIVRRELKRWRLRAEAIGDPKLRALALAKLDGEGSHAEAASMLATFAPRARRASVVEAIVALELLFDYLDGLSELPARDPLPEGDRMFGALVDAVTFPCKDSGGLVEQSPRCNDGGYLDELSRVASLSVARLPAALAITRVAQRVAARSGQAQTRMHAAPQLGIAQLEQWGRRGAEGTGLEWREFVAGAASSVLMLHALSAAAADPRTTADDAARIEEAYLSVCVLLTLLDGLVDYEQDMAEEGSQRPGYLSLFGDRSELVEVLGRATRRAATQARGLPNGARHVMLLTGVVGYYASAPGADGEPARGVTAQLRHELGPLMSATLGMMRAWRRGRRERAHPERVESVRASLKARSRDEVSGRPGAGGEMRSRFVGAARFRVAVGVALGAVAMIAGAAAILTTSAWGGSDSPRAQVARVLNVRDEGRLHYVRSFDSEIIDEGQASGTFPGRVKVHFTYTGEPTVGARFTIYSAAGSISARGSARLSSLTSARPSFRGTMKITGGSGRYAQIHGGGGLYGVYYRRSYGLTVQAVAKLAY
ncbi:MAG TPA: DUF2600 family protein [Solirubrobacteraceae bacterium]|nr:DUF2600 family protein [Solirubrobacteraceae bacterium]